MTAASVEQSYKNLFAGGKSLFSYEGVGTTSKQTVKVFVYEAQSGAGINFVLPNKDSGEAIKISAKAENVVNTLRNVTIGHGKNRLCLVEHFLAAAALCDCLDLDVLVEGPELPLGDGSAELWLELFRQAGRETKTPEYKYELQCPVSVKRGDRQLLALPASEFSITYLMDWSHPAIGKKWCSWNNSQPAHEISCARTFGSKKEHDLLGIGEQAVSLTENGFDKPLHFEDEPVRHKLLDLLGDLTLTSINPLSVKAQFISIKGGHEMDVELCKELEGKLRKVSEEK